MLCFYKIRVSVQVTIESLEVVSIGLVSVVNFRVDIRPRGIKFELIIEKITLSLH